MMGTGRTAAPACEIRPLTVADEPAVVALWNRAMGELFPLRRRLLHQAALGDPDLEPGDALVAWVDGEPAGFCLARTWPPRAPYGEAQGWLEALAVDPRRQRRGVGTALAGAAERALADRGVTAVWAGGGPAMLFPGVCTELAGGRRFLEGRGYALFHTVHDLIGDLDAMPHPPRVDAALAAAGAQVRPCAEAEWPAAVAFLERSFPGPWPRDRRRHHALGASAGEIYLLWVDGAIAGLAQTYSGDSPVLGPSVHWAPALGIAEGGLGPIGLAEAWRGRGLGLALLTLALEGLRRHGAHHAVIDWTELLDFYGPLGFRVWRSYLLGPRVS
ncbi:MAG TPA: GNAT family N-acetyltransferase [Anaerolineae bacterium]|nr:GNAT family N-acetyltransferase [Anaerolineae bacterium]HOQ98731.1 GNAT family N-acetyltransferase [Anaerolineae bacterium]HPL27566.1 GNAT family N-acetyltransferase [Anaerolineae bacterium]